MLKKKEKKQNELKYRQIVNILTQGDTRQVTCEKRFGS